MVFSSPQAVLMNSPACVCKTRAPSVSKFLREPQVSTTENIRENSKGGVRRGRRTRGVHSLNRQVLGGSVRDK